MIPTEELRRAYERGGYNAAIAYGKERGLRREATRSRLVHAGVHKPKPRAKTWTTLEVKRLTEMWNSGANPRAIAAALNRSLASVYGMVGEIPACVSRKKRPWSSANQRIVDEAVEQLIQHLARRFERTPIAMTNRIEQAVRTRARRLRSQKIDVGGMRTDVAAQPRQRAA